MAASDPTFPYNSNNASYNRYSTGTGSSSQSISQNTASQAYSSPIVNFQRQSLPNLQTASAATYVSAQTGLSNANGSLASYLSTQSTSRNGDAYASSSSSHAVLSEYQDIRNTQVGGAGSNGNINGMYAPTTTQHATIRELSPSPQNDDAGHESGSSSREGNNTSGNTLSNRQKSKTANKNAPQNIVESGDDSDGARNGSINGRKQKLTRIHQACINCGAKKQKCTGGNPCDACKTNGLECGYKESKKR